ncbi:MAG: CBS domain-containing protein [Candidatus Dadabacteria bacterium]|nr:CBS domain-containing protein [Candidatus Dadabacteria bacterium]NIV41407.1 CBS domain-containing protein [Candidatus Dadabacteria bacterium]
MIKNDNIRKILTTDVLSVHVNQKLSDVNKIFRENMIHHVPVLKGKKPIGIISTNDIFKLMFNIEIQEDDRMLDAIMDHHFSIKDAMSKDLVTLPITSTIKDITKILQFSTIHSVIITNEAGELEGIVTSTDLIKHLHDNIN